MSVQGWECPKCGSCYAGWVFECPKCSSERKIVYSSNTAIIPPPKEVGSMEYKEQPNDPTR